jgi:hypothetical protein
MSGPTAAHWRAVADAIEKFCGRGKWAGVTPRQVLPHFTIRWDDPNFAYHRAAGETALFRDGQIVVALRSDLSPRRVHETMLHELRHVADHALIRSGRRSRAYVEARAQVTAACLGALK